VGKPNEVEHFEDENFDDVDLNTGGADELAKLAALADEAEQANQGKPANEESEPATEETVAEEPEADEKTDETPTEEPKEEEAEEAEEEKEEDKSTKDQASAAEDSAAQVRADREALQKRLDELQVTAMADRQRLMQLEQALATPKEPEKPKEPEGPTPEEIVQRLDARISELDTALAEAEKNKPEDAAGLRTQLRQVERYYNDFVAQQRIAQAKGPDPASLVSEAVNESQAQLKFNTVRDSVTQQYPMLDVKSEYFSEDMRDQVHDIYNPLIQAGQDPAEALQKASVMVMRANGVMSMDEYATYQKEQEAATQNTAAETAAQAAKAADTAKKSTAQTAEERKKEAVARNVAAATAAPPALGNLGEGNKPSGPLDKYNFADMSVEEMMKISDEEESRIEAALSMYND
jgi:hypothetical protein